MAIQNFAEEQPADDFFFLVRGGARNGAHSHKYEAKSNYSGDHGAVVIHRVVIVS